MGAGRAGRGVSGDTHTFQKRERGLTMSRTTRRARASSGEAAVGHCAVRGLRGAWRLLPAVLAAVLLVCGALSGSAGAETTKAPAVTKQPVSKTVEEGQSAVFEAAASGVPVPTVQWEISTSGGSTWSAVPGATSNKLTIPSTVTTESTDQFRAVFKNAVGEATSKAVSLTVRAPPFVTLQPASQIVEEGQSVDFEAFASGAPAPTVQWERSINGGSTWTVLSGASSDKLTIASAKTSESGYEFRATFKNAVGKATSEAATLSVRKAPVVTKQPLDTTVNEGDGAAFEATASGFPSPTVQWEVSADGGSTWSPIGGGTSDRLTIASATGSEDGYEYRAVFANAAGEARSAVATLTVHAPPLVIEQPAGITIEVGQSAVFEAAASGFPAPTVQWEISTNSGGTWSTVQGATSDQLAVANATASENGDEYRARFTNAAGQATTAVATLTVATTHYAAVAWGQNLYRQLGNGSLVSLSDVPVTVSGLKFVTAIAAGGRHSLALLANGTVVAWGENEFGQLGDGSTDIASIPAPVSGLTGVKAIAAGENHSLALLSNGTVMAWGDNENGQLGDGGTQESEVPVTVKGLTGVKAIAAGGNHSLALLSNGTVMAWGDNESGQLGNGATKSSTAPVAVRGLSGVSAISAGDEFSLALLSKATVEAWGSNEFGQLGNSAAEEGSDVPVAVSGLGGVTSIAAGAEHSLALLGNGTAMAWGEDRYGELGSGTIETSDETPVAVSGLSDVVAISAGGQDSVALLGQGSVTAWGINRWGTLGDGTTGSPSDVPVTVSGIGKVASVSAGGSHMLAYGEPKPAISNVSPNIGPSVGANTVTLTGVNLMGATAVKFGANPATGVTDISENTVTAVAPAGTGTVDITVTTPAGISATGSADRYTYRRPPTVLKLSPKSGPAGGGTSVIITGTEFTGATSVSFGADAAVAFTVNSATSITAEAPTGAAGVVDVTVGAPGGVSASSSKDHFTYTPTITAVTPNAGSTAGGTGVTVTGSDFALGGLGTTFKFGTKKATAVNCTTSTSCAMIVPAGTAGTINVTAQVNKVTSPVNAPGDEFTYS
jgi:alpha-tubulin suppressor-like RCC1 family protein